MVEVITRILPYAVFFTAMLALGKLYLEIARRKKILDIPSARSSHAVPTVRGGGIIFFVTGLFIMFVLWTKAYPLLYLFAGFFILGLMGWIDDKKELSPFIRFPFQLIAVLLILYQAGFFHWSVSFYWKLLGVIVSLGFVNAFNFMDGINGITGFYTFVLILTYYVINRHVKLIEQEFFFLLMIAVLAFGYFNFRNNAQMFSGDIGTMSLAALLLWLILTFMVRLNAPVLLVTVIVYGTDSAMTIIRRLLHKQNIFKAHRWHIYQHLVDKRKWSHLSTALVYALLQLSINVLIINFKAWEWSINKQIFFLALLLTIFVSIYLTIQRKQGGEKKV